LPSIFYSISTSGGRWCIGFKGYFIDQAPPKAAERRGGLILEIEIAKRLPGAVADDEARIVVLLDDPRRREAAHGAHGALWLGQHD